MTQLRDSGYYEIEYQWRSNGNALGTPQTVVIDYNPKSWRKHQCRGVVLLSSTQISREQFMMRTLSAEAVLDGFI